MKINLFWAWFFLFIVVGIVAFTGYSLITGETDPPMVYLKGAIGFFVALYFGIKYLRKYREQKSTSEGK